MAFPTHRMRRLRRNSALRSLVRETTLDVDDFIMPLFVCEGSRIRREIAAMPRNFHLSPDLAAEECREIRDLGIPAVILFGIPEKKDATGSSALDPNGVIQQAIRKIKAVAPDLLIITDVCLCEYTSHGHCGILKEQEVDNDRTLEILTAMSVSHAEAGADLLAPSDMMDGRIGAIRRGLDDAGFSHLAIMAYAAKYASGFYGPFREAADSAPSFGDRSSYQMDPPNAREALREIELDLQEGADIVMVKPALAYLDVICRARDRFDAPIAAYNVSGEFSMVKAAAQSGWIDEKRVALEILTSIKRAGADMILTYFAKDAARWLS
ncbi:MAG TPA: porphobilinogen synthase [bacterium]|nr:porphobilinogen synthase [bacterium]HQL63143.1 porphobilinogen synthase [bacterium]